MSGLNLTQNDKEKLGVIIVAMTVGVPLFGILFSIIGLTDQPISLSVLRFSAVFGFGFSLLMVGFYIAIHDKVP